MLFRKICPKLRVSFRPIRVECDCSKRNVFCYWPKGLVVGSLSNVVHHFIISSLFVTHITFRKLKDKLNFEIIDYTLYRKFLVNSTESCATIVKIIFAKVAK